MLYVQQQQQFMFTAHTSRRQSNQSGFMSEMTHEINTKMSDYEVTVYVCLSWMNFVRNEFQLLAATRQKLMNLCRR